MPENQPVTSSTTLDEAIRAVHADIQSHFSRWPRNEISAADNPLAAIESRAIGIAAEITSHCLSHETPGLTEAHGLAHEIVNIAHDELNRGYQRIDDFRLQLFPFDLALDLLKAAADLHFGKGKHRFARRPSLFSRLFEHKISLAHDMGRAYKHEPKELQGGQIACFLEEYNIPKEPMLAFLQGYQPPNPS